MLYCEIEPNKDSFEHFCAISLSALALDKAAREASKYT